MFPKSVFLWLDWHVDQADTGASIEHNDDTTHKHDKTPRGSKQRGGIQKQENRERVMKSLEMIRSMVRMLYI